MTLINRKTIVDRPELVDRGDNDDGGDNQTESEVAEVLGNGDGPAVNGIRFEQGDYGIVAASNLIAVLSTAQTEGDEFERSFMTSAIQMKEMTKSGVDISPIASMSRSRGIDDLNIEEKTVQQLKLATQNIGSQPASDEDVEDDDDDEVEEDDESSEEPDVVDDEDGEDEQSDEEEAEAEAEDEDEETT